MRLRQHGSGQLRLAPARAAVGGYLDLAHPAAAGPRESADDVRAGPRQPLSAGRPGDDRVRPEVEAVALCLRIRRQEARMLLERQVRLVDDLDPLEPLHVVDALEAGHDQAQREAVVGAHRLAVLPVGHQHVVERLGQRDALGMPAAVGAFGDDPGRAGLHAHLVEQHRQRHAGPLAASHAAVRPGDGRGARVRPVADAFEEVHAGETNGSRRSSSMVKTSGRSTSPSIISVCSAGLMSGMP